MAASTVNRDNCIQLLRGMLDDQAKPVIFFVHQDEKAGEQIKHLYRFFIVNSAGIFNISGLITTSFGANVSDRSQTFSINTNNHEEDIKAFTDSLRKVLLLPELVLKDLILSAKETLEFQIHPDAIVFMPIGGMPIDREFRKQRDNAPELTS